MGPNFIIIGAMKCATSTLHEQLARQPGFFMTSPKEPNFFGDDAQFARGLPWYETLFQAGQGSPLRGESSTHYTKLPTFPDAAERMHRAYPDLRLVYMMKHPLDRLISHYIHEWTMKVISVPLDDAVTRHPELVSYSQYHRQLAPYLERFGPASVLPVFVGHFQRHPTEALNRITRFLGMDAPVTWMDEVGRANASAERLRLGPVARWAMEHPVLTRLRRALVPQTLRDGLKARMQMRDRPQLSDNTRAALVATLDADLAKLGSLLGVSLCCDHFEALTSPDALEWQATRA